MSKIVESSLSLIGGTPLLRASRYAAKAEATQADILVKLEYLNPAGSVKDRIALAMIGFLTLCLGIMIGGAYHSHCAYLGLVGKMDNEEVMNVIIRYFSMINKCSFLFLFVGLLILFICVAFGWTCLPSFFAFFTPGILYLLLPVVRKLPKGIHIIVCGGWSNLIFVIYYVALIIYTLGK